MHLYDLEKIEQLPDGLRRILNQDMPNVPLPLMKEQWLTSYPVDHVAFALESNQEFEVQYEKMVELFPILEDMHVWPDDINGCPQVPQSDRKYMASFLVEDARVVLLSSYSSGDVISNFVQAIGDSALHHIALTVPDIAVAVNQLTHLFPNVKQITQLAHDEYMAQVFFQIDGNPKIIELVERSHNFQKTFTCSNVRQLTEGERLNWQD